MAMALNGLDRVEEATYSAEQVTQMATSALLSDHSETEACRNLQFLCE